MTGCHRSKEDAMITIIFVCMAMAALLMLNNTITAVRRRRYATGVFPFRRSRASFRDVEELD